jgi:hypothetical protein
MVESVLFIVLVVIVQAWLVQRVGRSFVPNALTVILVTGILSDLVREWRANEPRFHLTPIWEIHQVYAVAPALRLLEAGGFQAFAQGLRLRSLLQFFGPYVPVRILVPAAQAQAAYSLLQSRWPWPERTDSAGSCRECGTSLPAPPQDGAKPPLLQPAAGPPPLPLPPKVALPPPKA